MPRENLNDLIAFLAVARERSFTRAAAQLGVSQSALSHTIRGLEERIGLRLLTRTTRSVSPTEAGERLLRTVGPRFEEIDAELAALSELREKPAGTIRITAHEHAANAVLWPALERFLPDYPDIKVEIVIDYGLTDIVAERGQFGVDLIETRTDGAEQAFARFRRRDATGGAGQQPQAKPLFETSDGVAQRRLRHAELRGGPGEAALPRDREEGDQIVKAFPRHS